MWMCSPDPAQSENGFAMKQAAMPVRARDVLDDALQQHAVIARELDVRHVMQVDLELSRPVFRQRRRRGMRCVWQASRHRRGSLDFLEILEAVALRPVLASLRTGMNATLGVSDSAASFSSR
jgi:hypothetical protein